jgi:hypothetical protein
MTRSLQATLMIICCLIIFGCSQNTDSPVSSNINPGETGQSSNPAVSSGNNFLLGYYDVYFDIQNQKFEAVFNRSASFTLNIVPFLNKMTIPQNGITLDSIVIHNDDPSFIGVDVTFSIYHPFPGYPQYDAYDMRGVLIGNGSRVLDYDGLRTPEHTVDLWMNNPDGYTRWFNPTEFTTELIFGYAPGGFQNLAGDSQVNPYKYYGKHLGASDDLWSWLTSGPNYDGIFESGSGRRMEIEFPMPPDGIGIMFGYAVVVSWDEQGPVGPYHPVHCPEAVAASVTQTPNVWNDGVNSGGDLILDVDLYGWEYQPSIVLIESDLLDGIADFDFDTYASPGGENYSTWHVEAPSGTFTGTDGHDFWVIAEYGGFDYKNGLPEIPSADGALAAFFRYDAIVLPESPTNSTIVVTGPDGGEVWFINHVYDITWDTVDVNGNAKIEFSKTGDSGPWAELTSSVLATEGLWNWIPQLGDVTDQGRIKVSSVDDPSVFDISDADFSIHVASGDEITDLSLLVTRVAGGTAIENIELHWTDSGAEQYIVYWDQDPYDNGGVINIDYGTEVAVVTGSPAIISTFDHNGGYVFSVRVRLVADDPMTESGDSNYALIEMENGGDSTDEGNWLWGGMSQLFGRQRFDRGATYGNGEWGWFVDNGNNSDSCMAYWSALSTPQLPYIDTATEGFIEFGHKYYLAWQNATFPGCDNPFNFPGFSAGGATSAPPVPAGDYTGDLWPEYDVYNDSPDDPPGGLLDDPNTLMYDNPSIFQFFGSPTSWGMWHGTDNEWKVSRVNAGLTDPDVRYGAIATGSYHFKNDWTQNEGHLWIDDIAVIVY